MTAKKYMLLFEMVDTNYVWMNGKTMNQSLCDLYNYLTDRIRVADEAGMIEYANQLAEERRVIACDFVNGVYEQEAHQ